ncbi:unnamed protein product [Rhizoctonia solani]|uniref:Laccase n=1 Tax=Rhizoctonia solani TaxID=456999 RepID=A0A8H2XT42_9AGAM|nr:unnamed protein product [Rhizoctonia solani]
MTRITFLGSVSLFASAVLARTVEYNWKIVNKGIAPDGVERDAVLVNGRYPGPLVYANKGDILKIKVQNKLTDDSMEIPTTIHWHGLHQHRNADDDGPAFVTQCPITPEASYTYKIPLGDQTGTYWYHSHMSTQYIDGLRGPLVIYDPDDPHKNLYDIDDEKTVLTIGDWYHDSAKLIEASGNITRQRPDSATINGKGRFNSSIPANPDTLYTLKVKHGKRYRLRVINTSAIASFLFGVQGHKLKVIAVDAVPIKPYEVDSLEILVGQRYDCILEANQKPDTYWINAPLTNVANKTTQALIVYEDDSRPYHPPSEPYRKWTVSEDVIRYWQHSHGHHGAMSGRGARGIEVVAGNSATQPRNDTSVTLDTTKLVPLESPGACGSAPYEKVHVYNLTFGLGPAAGKWNINGVTYTPPKIPTLLKILADKDGVTQSDFSTSEHTVILPKNECIEFNIKGNSGLNITHPIHLHGHFFDVVQFGNSAPNYVNPPRRDVVGSTDQGVRIRFKTDNPGPWFLHCHIDWHLVEGFAMVFAEAPEAIKDGPQSVHVDPEWKGLCEKISLDVTNKESIESAVKLISSENDGKLDTLINNAGQAGPKSMFFSDPNAPERKDTETLGTALFKNESFEGWSDLFSANVSSIFFVSTALLGLLEKASKAREAETGGWSSSIINITSVSGQMKQAQNHFAYNSSKAAGIHLTKMLSTELALHKIPIRVNTISPGPFPSEMTGAEGSTFTANNVDLVAEGISKIPSARGGLDKDIAGAALYLASPASYYVNGQVISVDGGFLAVNPAVV